MYTTSRIHLAVCLCLPALLALVTFAQSSSPASAQSQPLERAPQHEEAEANEPYPNLARPPWTGPDQPDPARPGPYERFILPRSSSSTSRTCDLPGGRIYQDERRLVLRGYHPYAGYHCWPPADFGRALDEAYLYGRAVERDYQHHRFNVNDMNRRKARMLSQQEKALRLGLERLRDGEYARAVIALSLAAELDQGDPACRIHLAQARLALGHYDEAGKVLRRALQLQPRLVYADLHLERYYPTEATLDALAERLGRQVRKDGATAEALFLYGYLEFQRGRFGTAHAAFRRVSELLPKDTLTRTYLGITRPAETDPAEASTSGSPPVTGPRRAQTR